MSKNLLPPKYNATNTLQVSSKNEVLKLLK